MKRSILNDLERWMKQESRRPLVLRGARQVGKTWLVRELARRSGRELLELNFERSPDARDLFQSTDPKEIVRGVEAFASQRLHPSDSILFLDEIQAAPEVLARLRWFAEELPELPVVAAGSLLDFVLEDHAFSMPVGRITYLHLEPMSFEEFLLAEGGAALLEAAHAAAPDAPLAAPLHEKLMASLRSYMLVGGLPAVVDSWVREQSLLECARLQHDLLLTYRDDFGKYAGRVPSDRLQRVLSAIPRLMGKKFTYSRVDANERAEPLRKALELLERARVCHRVRARDATGVPLGAEVRDRVFKMLHLDVGLASAALGLSVEYLRTAADIALVNEGALAEQLVGQALRCLEPAFKEPETYYWCRSRRGSEAELDFVVQHGPQVVPIEVKAGSTGGLKSLHAFMASRKLQLAVRFNADPPSVTEVDMLTTGGERAAYTLLSLPIYLVSQLHVWLNRLETR